MELVLDVLHYRVRRSGDASLDAELTRMRNKALGAFVTAYQLATQPVDARDENAGCPTTKQPEEVKGAKSKYSAVQSKDGQFFSGASYRCGDLDASSKPLVSGVKLSLYAVNGLEIIDIGSCRWRPEASSSSLLGRGYQCTATLDITSPNDSHRSVGKVTCSISIVRESRNSQARGHEEEKHLEHIPVPQFKFRGFTTAVNWNRVCGVNLQQVVDEADGEALLACQRDVATGDLSQEKIDPWLQKPMELASYTVQYLGSCLELLQHRQSMMHDASRTFQEEEDALDMHLARLRARETALRRECDSLDETRRDFCSLLRTVDPHLAKDYDANHRTREHRDDYEAELAIRRPKAAEFRNDFGDAAQVEVETEFASTDTDGDGVRKAASPNKSKNGEQSNSSAAWASQRSIQETSPSSPGSSLRPGVSSSPIKQQQQQRHQVQLQPFETAADVNSDDDAAVVERGGVVGFSSREFDHKQREDDVDLPMQASLSLRASMHGMNRVSRASSVMSVDSLGFGMFARQSTAEALRGQTDEKATDLVEAFRNDTDSDDDDTLQAASVLPPTSPTHGSSLSATHQMAALDWPASSPSPLPPSTPISSSSTSSSSYPSKSSPPLLPPGNAGNLGGDDGILDLEDFDGAGDDEEDEEEVVAYRPSSFRLAEQAKSEGEHDDVFEHSGGSGHDSLAYTSVERDALMRSYVHHKGDDSVEVDLSQFGGTVTGDPDDDEDDDVVLFGTGSYRPW